MKTIETILSDLYKLDFQLWVEDAETQSPRLKFNAPEEALTPQVIDILKENKEEIIKFLNQTDQALKSTTPTIQTVSREENLPLSFSC